MRSWIKEPIILKNKDDMSIANAEMISDRIQYIAGEVQ